MTADVDDVGDVVLLLADLPVVGGDSCCSASAGAAGKLAAASEIAIAVLAVEIIPMAIPSKVVRSCYGDVARVSIISKVHNMLK